MEGTELAIVKREFFATNSQTKEERKITQFHFQNWPDFKAAPNNELFACLLKHVEAHHKEKDTPLTVHCAAGMGRAGAFIAAHALRRKIHREGKEAKINFPEIVFKMRECRKDMVSKSSMPSISQVLLQ